MHISPPKRMRVRKLCFLTAFLLARLYHDLENASTAKLPLAVDSPLYKAIRHLAIWADLGRLALTCVICAIQALYSYIVRDPIGGVLIIGIVYEMAMLVPEWRVEWKRRSGQPDGPSAEEGQAPSMDSKPKD